MPNYKFTMIFQWAGGSPGSLVPERVGGWSESVLTSADPFGSGAAAASLLQNRRAGCLATSAAIVGQRAVLLGSGEPSRASRTVYPGTAGEVANMPQDAVRFHCIGSANQVMPVTLRAIPDGWVAGGKYVPGTIRQARVDSYKAELVGYGQIVRNLQAFAVDINSISTTGRVLTRLPFGAVANGDRVQVLRPVVNVKVSPGGRYTVIDVITASDFQLLEWPIDIEATGGVVRFASTTVNTYANNWFDVPPIVKKIGKAPFQFRGRRKKNA